MTRRSRFPAVVAAIALAAACASEGMPPGGPVDKTPPKLIAVTPESGSLHVGARQVVIFRFDEVIAERTHSGTALDQAVVVSPSDGAPSVDWHRTYISVRSHKGWRPDVAYSVTILPGLQDLSNNTTRAPLQTVFSTGTVIPHGEVRGVVFDWVGQRAASGARIEAMTGKDTTLKYTAVADSTGRFVIPILPPGALRLRAYIDANRNQVLDSRESWDSSSVALADTATREFYVFAHDTVGPSITDVTVLDSMTLRVHFDRPLLPGAPLDASQFSLKLHDTTRTDSVPVAVRRVSSAARYDTLAQQRRAFVLDSTMRADTTAAGRRAVARRDSLTRAAQLDSASAAQVASVKASRDTTKVAEAPKPSRPAPLSEVILELAAPLPYDVFGALSVSDAVGLTGHVHHPARSKQLVLRKPAPKDSTASKPRRP